MTLTFSIPNRIEPSATRLSLLWHSLENHFQYPQSDRALCNILTGFMIGQLPFFQYPQSDRALCNIRNLKIPRRRPILSVSPIGSSPLQHQDLACRLCRPETFSIPNRIEPSATLLDFSPHHTPDSLSVSPIGSSPLQLSQAPEQDAWEQAFSIPNRIEPSATRRDGRPGPDRLSLSVSPIGSSPLQRVAAMSSKDEEQLSVSPIGSSPLQRRLVPGSAPTSSAFSIPNRIEPSATRWRPKPIALVILFQYPQSDRALCNRQEVVLCVVLCVELSVSPIGSSPLQQVICSVYVAPVDHFQYPQSDRALCNPVIAPDCPDPHSFQYPQSDRALCNCPRRQARRN